MVDIKKHIGSKLLSLPIKTKGALLYGSFAQGTYSRDSDIDILFISDEVSQKKHKRGREIAVIKEHLALPFPLDILLLTSQECLSNFRNHNPLFLDIASEGIIVFDENNFLKSLLEETKAYITEKRIRKMKEGWAFPVLDRTPSFLSKVSNKDFAIVMLTDGERDFHIGVAIMGNGYFDKAVYHFQQSVEKVVKAILICFGIFQKTHFVGEILLQELEKKELDRDWKEKLKHIGKISSEIEPEVTWSRYPGIDNDVLWIPSEEYSADDANEIKDKCKQCLDVTKDFFAWWFIK
jgi:HEPN domain-containing protein/predicted nucleotidyltransferase